MHTVDSYEQPELCDSRGRERHTPTGVKPEVLCGSFCTFPSRIPAQQANHEHVTPSRIGRGCGPHISMIAASSAVFHCQGAPASLRLSAHCRRARDQQRTASASDLADSGTDSPYLRKQTSRTVDPCEQPERGSSRGRKGHMPAGRKQKALFRSVVHATQAGFRSTSTSRANHAPPHTLTSQ